MNPERERKQNPLPENTAPGNAGEHSLLHSRGAFWLRLILDVLAAALMFGVFYLFLAILPQQRQLEVRKAAMETAESAGPGSVQTEVQAPEASSAEADSEETAPAGSVDAGDSASDAGPAFAERFAEFFTDEIVRSKDSYSSPDISVKISTVEDSEHGVRPFRAYVADIHVASVRNIRAGFPNGQTASPGVIARENRAVLAVNGDFYLYIRKALIVRNGVMLKEDAGTMDICALFEDGTMETYGPGEYTVEEILNRNPWQVWSFGPALLDADGAPKTDFNTSSNIGVINPRTAIGFFEPGHYCLVVIDGRQAASSGAEMEALAAFMADLGCKVAFNLDGGDSSAMYFNQRILNRPSGGGRVVSDIVMLCELPED